MRDSEAMHRAAPICALCLLALFPALSHAQQQNREREAIRRMQQQLSKTQTDLAAAQREKGEIEQKLKAAEAELAKLQGQARKSASALGAAGKENAELRGKLAATEDKLKETAQQLQHQTSRLQRELQDAQSAAQKSDAEAQRKQSDLQTALEKETDRAKTCEEKNAKLYSVTMDLVAKYKQTRGAWERLLLAEPFTGLKSVEVENLLEEMRDRAADAKIEQK
jgi:septal ring factor EnvC (AmiA/AmiB activator)